MAATKAVLIIGGSGFVGSHLAVRLRDTHKVFATYFKRKLQVPGVTYLPIDIANRNWAKRIAYATRPDVIIYAVGRNDLFWAEQHQREAENALMHGVGTVSTVSDIFQPKFIYLSSCYAFDGEQGNYRETDTVLPTTIFGKAKVGGENFIRGRSLNWVIVRSSPLLGRGNGRNFSLLDKVRMSLDRNHKVEFHNSELHSFATVDGLGEVVSQIIAQGVRNKVLHFGGLTKVSYLDFARRFAKRFKYDSSLVVAAKSASTAGTLIEQKRYDFSLNSTQAIEALKIKPLLLEESFDLIEQKLVTRL